MRHLHGQRFFREMDGFFLVVVRGHMRAERYAGQTVSDKLDQVSVDPFGMHQSVGASFVCPQGAPRPNIEQ